MKIGTRVRSTVTLEEGTVIEVHPTSGAVCIKWDNGRGLETLWYALNCLATPGGNPLIEVLDRS